MKSYAKHSLYGIGVAITLVFSILVVTNSVYFASAPSAPLPQKKQVTLTAVLEDQGDREDGNFCFNLPCRS